MAKARIALRKTSTKVKPTNQSTILTLVERVERVEAVQADLALKIGVFLDQFGPMNRLILRKVTTLTGQLNAKRLTGQGVRRG